MSNYSVSTTISKGELLQRLAIGILGWSTLGALLWHEPPRIFYGTLAITWVLAHNLTLYYRAVLVSVIDSIKTLIEDSTKQASTDE